MVKQYNNTSQYTLSKYIGFREHHIMMFKMILIKKNILYIKVLKENGVQYTDGFVLKIGSKIKVFNEKDVFGK